MIHQDIAPLQYSADEIEAGLRTAARLCKRYGDAYLPYFLYLEQELAAVRERDAVSDRINALLRGVKV